MDKAELFDLLEIEDPEELEYFEQFAALVETEDEIEYEDFFSALSKASGETLSEITENYFTELEKFIPSGSDDIFEIVENIFNGLRLALQGVSESLEARKDYIQQLFKFREWYTKDDGASVDGKSVSVVDAIFEYRAEKLGGTKHKYSFDNSLDYGFDYLSMPIGGFDTDEYESNDVSEEY